VHQSVVQHLIAVMVFQTPVKLFRNRDEHVSLVTTLHPCDIIGSIEVKAELSVESDLCLAVGRVNAIYAWRLRECACSGNVESAVKVESSIRVHNGDAGAWSVDFGCFQVQNHQMALIFDGAACEPDFISIRELYPRLVGERRFSLSNEFQC
jgi:hypothetical protein